MEWKIPLTEPDIGEAEIRAVTDVLHSKWLTMGAVTAEFEKAFASKMNVRHALAVSNCTAALHLANLALGITAGDEVICPDLTFVATANAIRYTGAKVVFADIVSEREPTISPADIEAKITARTKAIAVVHYAGFACLMDEIMEIARQFNLRVIEDCAHAPFARHRFRDGTEKYTGAIGDIGCFSFFGNKNITTGEGGMVTTNDDSLAEKIRLLRSHGMTTLTYERHKGHASEYDVIALGYNYRLDEIRSAIGLCQLEKIDRLNEKRREVYRWYINELADSDKVIVPFSHRDLRQAVCHLMPVFVKEGGEETKLRLRRAGVQTSRHYSPVSTFNIYGEATPPVTARVSEHLLTLPLGPTLSREDVKFIAQQIEG